MTTDFSALPLRSELMANLASLDFHSMTEVQAQSLPPLLAGKDLLAQAKTGSGKTAAFGLWLLNALRANDYVLQALVLCPTRELAEQVAEVLRQLARALANTKIVSVCGGKPIGPQIAALRNGAQIVVGTPGRVEDHIRKGSIETASIHCLVLDEADRMLDMGFQTQLEAIIAALPTQRQTGFFSATFPEAIANIAQQMLHAPVSVKVEENNETSLISQQFYCVEDPQHRLLALRLLLLEHLQQAALIFCNTKQDVKTVLHEVRAWGFEALALHGDLDQKDRDKTLVRFAQGSANVLIATDVAARGIDIDTVGLVINYQLSREVEVHTHRIGRTGRAGNSGLACTLFSDKERHRTVQLLESFGMTLETSTLPPKSVLAIPAVVPPMVSLQINGGKKNKLRPGDIVGALTAGGNMSGDDIGKISVRATWSYVAVQREYQQQALEQLNQGKLKGRKFQARVLK